MLFQEKYPEARRKLQENERLGSAQESSSQHATQDEDLDDSSVSPLRSIDTDSDDHTLEQVTKGDSSLHHGTSPTPGREGKVEKYLLSGWHMSSPKKEKGLLRKKTSKSE